MLRGVWIRGCDFGNEGSPQGALCNANPLGADSERETPNVSRPESFTFVKTEFKIINDRTRYASRFA